MADMQVADVRMLIDGLRWDRRPEWDASDRLAERERSRAEMRAEQRGYQLAQLRKNAGPSHSG